MKKFEIKAILQRTTYEEAYMEIYANSEAEAKLLISENEGEWMGGKEVDGDSKWIDMEEWEVISKKPYPKIDELDNTEEHN